MDDESLEEKGAKTWAGAPSTVRDGDRRAAGSGGRLRAGEGDRYEEEAGRHTYTLWVRSHAGGEEKDKVKITYPTVCWQDNLF